MCIFVQVPDRRGAIRLSNIASQLSDLIFQILVQFLVAVSSEIKQCQTCTPGVHRSSSLSTTHTVFKWGDTQDKQRCEKEPIHCAVGPLDAGCGAVRACRQTVRALGEHVEDHLEEVGEL